jgi:protein SCO1/2
MVQSPLLWFIFVFVGFSYPIYRSLNRELPPPLPVLFQLPKYQLTNSFGQPFGSDDLKGRSYIANFIFTSCPTTCPAQMEKTQEIQKRVRGLGTKIGIVSFSVDPENDTPKVLHKYARNLSANPHVWTFLTAKDRNQIHDLLVDGFKVPMGELEEVEGVVDREKVTVWDIVHSERFALVDSQGQVRGYYSTTQSDIDKLMIDVGLLVNREQSF